MNDATPSDIYTLSLHDALPISYYSQAFARGDLPAIVHVHAVVFSIWVLVRSEEHTSELQSRRDLVCRLLLEKKDLTQARHLGDCLVYAGLLVAAKAHPRALFEE